MDIAKLIDVTALLDCGATDSMHDTGNLSLKTTSSTSKQDIMVMCQEKIKYIDFNGY
jgi:hypothetical protein